MEILSGAGERRLIENARRLKFRKNQYRAGTLAYLINRITAKHLISQVHPWLGWDGYFSMLVAITNNGTREGLIFSCLTESLFEQESRLARSLTTDSDVG